MQTGILGYGSLLNPREVEAMFGVEEALLKPVRVDGYRRSFTQKSLVREGDSGERAILTVQPSPEEWFNAVVVPLADEDMDYYRQREAGYTVTEVDPQDVETYRDKELGVTRNIDVDRFDRFVTAVGDRPLEDPRPIPYYVSICVEGARHWGDTFLTDFVVTTHRV